MKATTKTTGLGIASVSLYLNQLETATGKAIIRGNSLWADGYFAESVGVSDERMIRRDIREQKRE